MKKPTGEFVHTYGVNSFRFVWPCRDIGHEDVVIFVEYDYEEGGVSFEVWAQIGSYPVRACVMHDKTICEDDDGAIVTSIMGIINFDDECRERVQCFINCVAEDK
jgi:hypothetical protein